ncbi:GPP34 family phosphoprotein [Streptomyces sp. NPDC050703]|uniref:GOLPH3/VPS74 family protein n=1 Tax=Streptomyces sp. NPDC050703 TaxID=3157218 RepID=UPI003433CE0A
MHYGTLSLPARLFLLSWSPDRHRFTGGPDLHLAVRAGALAELAQRGLLHEAGGTLTPVAGSRTGDAVLDGVLDLVERSRPRGWRGWVTHRSGATLTAVRDELTAHGHLRAGHRRALGIFPVRYWEPERADHAETLRAEALAVLRGPLPVTDVAQGDAALVVCAATGKVRPLVTGRDRRRHKDRLEALTDRGGGSSPELRSAMRGLRKALASAVAAAEAARSSGSGGDGGGG